MKKDSIRLGNAAAAIRLEKMGISSAITLPSNAPRMKTVVMAKDYRDYRTSAALCSIFENKA
jgi:hypothetical protein